jgi:hypothetical protein
MDAQTPEVMAIRETGGQNRGKWVEAILAAVGLSAGDPWCMAFCVLRLVKAAVALGLHLPADVPHTGYTPEFANWAKGKGWWIPVQTAAAAPSAVRVGDLAFFYFPALGRIGHVGIVVQVTPWSVTTIEGNTNDGSGVRRDGNGVFRRHRAWGDFGKGGGFARLPF